MLSLVASCSQLGIDINAPQGEAKYKKLSSLSIAGLCHGQIFLPVRQTPASCNYIEAAVVERQLRLDLFIPVLYVAIGMSLSSIG
jgi:hypothetical protein